MSARLCLLALVVHSILGQAAELDTSRAGECAEALWSQLNDPDANFVSYPLLRLMLQRYDSATVLGRERRQGAVPPRFDNIVGVWMPAELITQRNDKLAVLFSGKRRALLLQAAELRAKRPSMSFEIEDGKLIRESTLDLDEPRRHLELDSPEPDAIARALKGQAGQMVVLNLAGREVYDAYPIDELPHLDARALATLKLKSAASSLADLKALPPADEAWVAREGDHIVASLPAAQVLDAYLAMESDMLRHRLAPLLRRYVTLDHVEPSPSRLRRIFQRARGLTKLLRPVPPHPRPNP